MDYKKMGILCFDTGIGTDHLTRLAQDFGKVYAYSPWQESKKFEAHAYGKGMAPNIEKVMHFFDYVDKVDLVAFLDIGAGDIGEYLRKQKKPVFGGGNAEKFEEYRYKFRTIQKALGLPVQKTEHVKGVTALREYIKKHPNVYVKIDTFRGDHESFKAKDYESVELKIDEIETSFGPFKEEFDFMVEEFIDTESEIGIDGFFNGKDWIYPTMAGYEVTASYIGKIYQTKAQLPKQLQDVIDKLTPLLQKANYRGPISVEVRIDKNKIGYVTDMTIRFAYSLSYVYTEFLENYSDIIWGVANGLTVVPRFSNKYLGGLALITNHGRDNWTRLIFPEKLKKYLKLEYSCKVGKYYYLVRDQVDIGILVFAGDTPQKIMDALREMAKFVDCLDLDTNLESLDTICKAIEEGKKIGIEF